MMDFNEPIPRPSTLEEFQELSGKVCEISARCAEATKLGTTPGDLWFDIHRFAKQLNLAYNHEPQASI